MRTPATYMPDLDRIRVDLPGPGFGITLPMAPDDAQTLATALKVALAIRENSKGRTDAPKRTRKPKPLEQPVEE